MLRGSFNDRKFMNPFIGHIDLLIINELPQTTGFIATKIRVPLSMLCHFIVFHLGYRPSSLLLLTCVSTWLLMVVVVDCVKRG